VFLVPGVRGVATLVVLELCLRLGCSSRSLIFSVQALWAMSCHWQLLAGTARSMVGGVRLVPGSQTSSLAERWE